MPRSKSSSTSDVDPAEPAEPIAGPNGVLHYPHGDVRRLFVLIAAIEALERPSLRALAAFTGQNTGSIHRDIRKINRELGVRIINEDGAFKIVEWGDLLRPAGVRRRLRGA